jgi:molybdopterin converting factor subunit 1
MEVEIAVRLFAAAKQMVGRDEANVTLSAPFSVARLRNQLAVQFPQISALAAQSRIAVNASYASPDQLIAETDEIALIPPVSGG